MYDFITIGALVSNPLKPLVYGGGGTNPYSIGLMLDNYGIRYKSVGLDEMTDEGVYIMSYWVGNVTEGIHTIALQLKNGQYTAYNEEGRGKTSLFDPQAYGGNNFVCCYYAGNKDYQAYMDLVYEMMSSIMLTYGL